MLAVGGTSLVRIGGRGAGATTSRTSKKSSLQRSSLKCYSTIRRRVVSPSSEASPKIYSVPESEAMEQKKKDLDREFDELFFRKPKVLIIGTNIASMTAALTLHSFNIKPDILDTGHYMHSLAPTNIRSQIVPMNAMRVFDSLGIRRQIEAIGAPISVYGRSGADGAALASLNFDSLRTHQDRPTLGVNYLELERTLQALVSEKSKIQTQCIIDSIDSPEAPDTRMAHVKWSGTYLGKREAQKGLYDCVLIGDGPFSISRELQWKDGYDLESAASYYEIVINRPPQVLKGFESDQWGLDRRVGFYPTGSKTKDQLYVYGIVRHPKEGPPAPSQGPVPATDFLEQFSQFGGPYREIAATIGAQQSVNKTILINGNFKSGLPPVKGRVVALGDTGITLPGPCLGHDIGLAIEQATYIANVLSYNTTPLFGGIHSYAAKYFDSVPLINSVRQELQSAVNFGSNLPDFFKRLVLKFTNSDRALVSQQMNYLGLSSSKTEEQESVSFSKIQQLRREWHKLSDADRETAKLQLKSALEQQQSAMEKELIQMNSLPQKEPKERAQSRND